LINVRIREIVMIKALSESYYSGDLPQTNIMTILDSVAKHSLFEANGIIAKNMIRRLTELVPGGKAPDFVLATADGANKTLNDFKGKHLYIHFMDPTSQKSSIEVDPLIKLYQTYKEDVKFITVTPTRTDEKSTEILEKIPWEKFVIDENASLLKSYKVQTFPYYILIDELGYVVAAPALTPMPSGQYETIDRTFFYIQKARKELKEYRR
jgi:peroxiredoxin